MVDTLPCNMLFHIFKIVILQVEKIRCGNLRFTKVIKLQLNMKIFCTSKHIEAVLYNLIYTCTKFNGNLMVLKSVRGS